MSSESSWWRRAADRVEAWWSPIVIPPRQRPWYFVIYLIVALTGFVTLLMPPMTVVASFGPALTTTWALFLTVGGALGASTVLTRYWAVERAAIGWIFTGLLMYAVVVLMQHLE